MERSVIVIVLLQVMFDSDEFDDDDFFKVGGASASRTSRVPSHAAAHRH